MGAISLRRRRDPRVDADVYEVKLDDDFLMSSLFTVAEVELARLALAWLSGGDPADHGLDVVVGGLGVGYTARTVLEYPNVRSLVVVEALDAVIDWHERGLVPAAAALTSDPRCRLLAGDFFAMVDAESGLAAHGRRSHAIIVDVDHSPRHLLHPSHAGFYTVAGTRRLAGQLHAGGVFAMWSNDAPDEHYSAVLGEVFAEVAAEVVSFANPLQGRDATNTVYLAR